jgi:G:T-mismatch repair DNA endonuclease (very short patch repair protein)
LESYPGLVSQWHSTRNGDLTPSSFTPGSDKKVWWVCEQGHEWEAIIRNRVNGRGCPACAGRLLIVGQNDLATVYPEVAAQWHPTKNGNLKPEDITATTAKKVWWKCSEGHEWQTSVYQRHLSVKRGSVNCKQCLGQIPHVGVTDLATVYPEVAAEWHPTRNTLTPEDVMPGSNKKVWWECNKGHEWEALVNNRTKKHSPTGCPYCSGKEVIAGVNDLGTLYPELIEEFHATLNTVPISSLPKSSNKTVWWVCKLGHEWATTVNKRTSRKDKCPYCSGRKVLTGFNDLKTTHPKVATQWHPTKNGSLTPETVTFGSQKTVWWQCDKNHEWEASIANRSNNNQIGTGCPKCSYSNRTSKPEQEIREYITSLGIQTEENNRTLIPPYELDIYIPERNLAIEFNGTYWHSELFKTPEYHYDKWKACKDKGIQLIQVWEDDWNSKKQLVKNMIAYKLGGTKSPTTYARVTKFIQVPKQEAVIFLETNHLQGYRPGATYYGLQTVNGQLVSIMGVSMKNGDLEIARFASAGSVPGSFSKLLRNILSMEKYKKITKVLSYSHNDYSDGGVYYQNGFTRAHEGKPGYSYTRNRQQREDRTLYQKKRFRKDPSLTYKEGLTETELAVLNGLIRVWDAGSSLWVKEIR